MNNASRAHYRLSTILSTCVLAFACAGTPVDEPDQDAPVRPGSGIPSHSWPGEDGPPDSTDIDLAGIPDAIPRLEARAARGNPPFYEVDGHRYFVRDSASGYVERGIASWYGTKFHGRETSSGEPYDMFQMSAAHRTLPLPSYARVTNLSNGEQVVVRINDRGPFVDNRLIDLSYAAAVRLDIVGTGTGLVEVQVLEPQDPDMPEDALPAEPVTGNPRIFLQAGAFSDLDNAQRVATRLRLANIYNVALYTLEGETPVLWRVRVGPLADVDEVDRVMARMQRAGFPDARVVID
jgi:rare lipoprotein A